MAELSRVERNVLLVLFSENRPLGERCDLHQIFGISMAKRHREKLIGLGYIHTTERPFVHSITEAGRAWLVEQTKAQIQEQTWHRSALFVMWRFAESRGISLSDIFKSAAGLANGSIDANGQTRELGSKLLPSGRTQTQMTMDADMKEVDEALALMLQDQPVIDRALTRLNQKASPTLQNELESTRRAINLVLQWGRRAADKRSIVTVGSQGEAVAFDPFLYETDEPTKTGALVQVRRAAVVRKTSTGDLILARGQAEPTN